MSNIDPMTGQNLQAAPTEQRSVGPRLSFEGEVPSVIQTDEEREYAHIARMSQKTKFATGNLDVDIANYLKIKSIAQDIVGLLGADD